MNREGGLPILTDDTIAWFECEVLDVHDAGTHLIFITKVLDGDVLDAVSEPLTYAWYRDVKKGKAPKNAPTFIRPPEAAPAKPTTPLYKFRCPICGYIYDPEEGDPASDIAPGTRFEHLPDSWVCPVCGVSQSEFNIL
jgi:rubredoxin